MKRILFTLMVIAFTSTLNSQTPAEAQFQTNIQRINTQGTTPPQVRYNFYTDKLNYFLNANEWLGDAVVSIKEIKIMPPNDPSDWYYLAAAKTKKCTKPFILTYDIGDSNLGEMFFIEPAGYPIEFKNALEKRRQAQENEEVDATTLKIKKEMLSEKSLIVYNEQVLPAIKILYEKSRVRLDAHVDQRLNELLDGYIRKDSTWASKDKMKKEMLQFIHTDNYNLRGYYNSMLRATEISDFASGTFLNYFVKDQKNAVNNYLLYERNYIEEIFKKFDEIDLYKYTTMVKKEEWYIRIHMKLD